MADLDLAEISTHLGKLTQEVAHGPDAFWWMRHNRDHAIRFASQLLDEVNRLRTMAAEAEARGYQRAIDALRARVKAVAEQSERDGVDVSDLVEAVQIAADYLEASTQTAIRSGESTDDNR